MASPLSVNRALKVGGLKRFYSSIWLRNSSRSFIR